MDFAEMAQAAQIAALVVNVLMVPPVLIVYKMVTNHQQHDLAEIKEAIKGLPCQEKTECENGSSK